MSNNRLQKLQELYTHSPEDPFLLYAIATEHVAAGSDAKALECFEMLTENHPGYVATYYHLAKLYERQHMATRAIETYTAGIAAARLAGDNHALAELQAAHTNLLLEMDDLA